MNINSTRFLVAHLGDLKISNSKSNQLQTNFKIGLTDMCLFSIDLNKETIVNNSPKSKFKLYFKPNFSEKIVYNTNAEINLEYILEFLNNKKLDFTERKFTETKNLSLRQQTCLRILFSVKNACKISISKPQLEQISTTLDNLIYKPIQADKLEVTNEEKNIIYDMCKEEKANVHLNLEIFFKLKEFEVSFLADVEKENQEFALLLISQFNLYMCKYENALTYIDVSLDDINLFDKLAKTKSQNEEGPNLGETARLLVSIPSRSKTKTSEKIFCKSKSKSESNLRQIRAENIFSNFLFKKKLEYYDNLEKSLSISVPDEISSYFSKHDYNFTNSGSNNNNNSTTSDANKSPAVQKKRAPRKKKISINIHGEASEESDCPQTPPPSPTQTFFKSSFLTKSESKIFEQFSDSSDEQIHMDTSYSKTETLDASIIDSSSDNTSNRINLILINEMHPEFVSKFKSVHRHVLINLSDLQININPETWIFFLDFLGNKLFD